MSVAGTPVLDEQPKSKRPSSSAFKQQKLPAWQPILTAGTVLPTFFVIGIAFIPIGIGLLFTSNEVQEKIIDYTDCKKRGNDSQSCAEFVQNNKGEICVCEKNFTLEDDFQSDVFMYYGLTNYYQNHRRYVKSRDDNQLLGNLKAVSVECEPFAYSEINEVKKPIAPCGAIANSLFNDTFLLHWLDNSPPTVVPLSKKGIAWSTDKNVKFQNPPGPSLEMAFKDTAKPLYWTKNIYDLDPDDPANNGFQNEDLIVWMRTAALPTFRKMYRRIDHSVVHFTNKLPKGQYTLTVNYSYPVSSFEGRKRVILSTTSWLGGKNPFLGIAYVVVGCICLVLGMVFLVIHIKFGKSTQEMVNISQRTGY